MENINIDLSDILVNKKGFDISYNNELSSYVVSINGINLNMQSNEFITFINELHNRDLPEELNNGGSIFDNVVKLINKPFNLFSKSVITKDIITHLQFKNILSKILKMLDSSTSALEAIYDSFDNTITINQDFSNYFNQDYHNLIQGLSNKSIQSKIVSITQYNSKSFECQCSLNIMNYNEIIKSADTINEININQMLEQVGGIYEKLIDNLHSNAMEYVNNTAGTLEVFKDKEDEFIRSNKHTYIKSIIKIVYEISINNQSYKSAIYYDCYTKQGVLEKFYIPQMLLNQYANIVEGGIVMSDYYNYDTGTINQTYLDTNKSKNVLNKLHVLRDDHNHYSTSLKFCIQYNSNIEQVSTLMTRSMFGVKNSDLGHKYSDSILFAKMLLGCTNVTSGILFYKCCNFKPIISPIVFE